MAEREAFTDEARSSHNAGLRALLERFENDISEIIRGDGLTGHEAVIKNDWNGSAQYKHKFRWKIEDGHITEIILNLEEEPLFKCLSQHLEKEELWGVFREWKAVARRCLVIWLNWYPGGEPDYTLLKKTKQQEVDMWNRLLGTVQKTRSYFWIPGECEVCRAYRSK